MPNHSAMADSGQAPGLNVAGFVRNLHGVRIRRQLPHESLMTRRLYLLTRDLHLYVGLFLSPFVLVFAVSVFYLVHGLASRPAPGPSDPSRTVANLNVSSGMATLQGRARVDALRPVLDQLGVRGEIDFVRHVANEHRLIVPVRLATLDTIVSIDYEQRTAT